MQRNRTRTGDERVRTPQPQSAAVANENSSVGEPSRLTSADAEGQLGPDELPDPNEVLMNLHAKRHP